MRVLDTALLRAARKAKGLSQERVGELLNCSHVTIQRWERGTREPSLYHLRLLCDLYDLSADSLIGRHKQRF